MYKKLDQFGKDHDKPILKLVEKESRRLVKITPGATAFSSAETKPEEEKNEGNQIIDYQKMKKYRNIERNTEMIDVESDEFVARWNKKMKSLKENLAKVDSCKHVANLNENAKSGMFICKSA